MRNLVMNAHCLTARPEVLSLRDNGVVWASVPPLKWGVNKVHSLREYGSTTPSHFVRHPSNLEGNYGLYGMAMRSIAATMKNKDLGE